MHKPRTGNYVSLTAEGPGVQLWFSEHHDWVSEQALRTIFHGVFEAIGSHIPGLPAGYHTRVVFESVAVLPQHQHTSCCCCIPVE